MEEAANPEPTDETLMARVRAGDEPARGILMARWEEPLKRFLYRLLLNPAEAEDLAQETCVKLFLHRAKYRPGAAFSPWVLTIAANLARNRRRWWHRHPTQSLTPTTEEGAAPAWEPADPAAGPAERAQTGEHAAAVRAAVAALPHELREAVVLAEYEGKSQAEIGAVLGCSAKAVEMRLYRARERLRQSLAPLLRR